MSKIVLLFVLVAVACSVNAQFGGEGWPASWFPNGNTGGIFSFPMKFPSPENIEKGGRGFSGSFASFSSRRNKDGKIEHSGEIISNTDGEVNKMKF